MAGEAGSRGGRAPASVSSLTCPVRWSAPALLDLVRLRDFLDERNPDAAIRAVRAIRQGVGALGGTPQMGRPVQDLPPEMREWVIPFGASAYLARYRFDGREVVVLALRHGREAGF